MLITLSPQVRYDTLTMSVDGDVLTINGEDYDFSPLTEGAELPADAVDSPFVVGVVTRVSGELRVTVILPITETATPEQANPQPVSITSGGVPLPAAPQLEVSDD